jgi:hypothetical protein
MISASWRPSASVLPAGVDATSEVGITGIAMGIGAEMPPTTSTSTCALAGTAARAAAGARSQAIRAIHKRIDFPSCLNRAACS